MGSTWCRLSGFYGLEELTNLRYIHIIYNLNCPESQLLAGLLFLSGEEGALWQWGCATFLWTERTVGRSVGPPGVGLRASCCCRSKSPFSTLSRKNSAPLHLCELYARQTGGGRIAAVTFTFFAIVACYLIWPWNSRAVIVCVNVERCDVLSEPNMSLRDSVLPHF